MRRLHPPHQHISRILSDLRYLPYLARRPLPCPKKTRFVLILVFFFFFFFFLTCFHALYLGNFGIQSQQSEYLLGPRMVTFAHSTVSLFHLLTNSSNSCPLVPKPANPNPKSHHSMWTIVDSMSLLTELSPLVFVEEYGR